jgi:hypothetical protein
MLRGHANGSKALGRSHAVGEDCSELVHIGHLWTTLHGIVRLCRELEDDRGIKFSFAKVQGELPDVVRVGQLTVTLAKDLLNKGVFAPGI